MILMFIDEKVGLIWFYHKIIDINTYGTKIRKIFNFLLKNFCFSYCQYSFVCIFQW